MKLLGLDFDNTLVRYDSLFYQLAIEKGLIDHSINADKTTIRNYLREKGKDEEFTLLQGEVYGSKILEAVPAEGMFDALIKAKNQGFHMVLISHKTYRPFKGPAYDLHASALSWLEKNNFFSPSGLNWNKSQAIFETTKEKKVAKIKELNCSYYIDDLPEILDSIAGDITKILYDPNGNYKSSKYNRIASWESLDLQAF